LKALYGPAATKENDFAFNYLPKIDRNYSWVNIWNDMYEGKIKGLFAFGMNGVMIGPDSNKNIDALKKADWLVVCEIYPDETSEFWRAPGITADDQKKINTTVYRLPGAGFAEKDGTFVNSARWLQWKNVAVPPPGEARLDQEILATIFLKVRELYQKEGGKFPDPVLNAAFAYTNPYNPSLAEVAKELNGKALVDITDPKTNVTIKAGQQLPGFAWLKDDGTRFRQLAVLRIVDRGRSDDAAARNRRSVGLGYLSQLGVVVAGKPRVYSTTVRHAMASGKPWDPQRRQVWWDEAKQSWVGNDVPDFKPDSAPKDHMGPFIMNPDGVGRLFVPLGGMADGPFPEYYEPIESPIANPLHPGQSNNPVVKKYKTDMDKYGTVDQGLQRHLHDLPADRTLSLLDEE
jgi:formate dehydrogenase major subunit